MQKNRMSKNVGAGFAPTYYTLQLVKLCMRPYAIAIDMSFPMWAQVSSYLEKPVALLRGWGPVAQEEWVGPNLTRHAKWGVGGAITTIFSAKKETDLMEFRVGLPYHSAGCRDFRDAYISLDILLRCFLWAQLDRRDAPLSANHQLIVVEELSPNKGLSIVLAPQLVRWFIRDAVPNRHYHILERLCETMRDIAKHLGTDLNGTHAGMKPDIMTVGPKFPKPQLTVGNVHLRPEIPIGRDPGTGPCRLLIESDYDAESGSVDPERMQMASMLFLCGLIELAYQAGSYGHVGRVR